MLRHTVFVRCADLVVAEDGHLADVFMGLAYGMYPFCVHEDPAPAHHGPGLLFRRVAVPADKEKDRSRRMAEAVEALGTLPGVAAYHAALTDGNLQLHVTGPVCPTVAWPIHVDADWHRLVVPDLLRWTQCPGGW